MTTLYEGGNVDVHCCLTLILDGSEQSVSRPDQFTAKGGAPNIQGYVAGWTAGQMWSI